MAREHMRSWQIGDVTVTRFVELWNFTDHINMTIADATPDEGDRDALAAPALCHARGRADHELPGLHRADADAERHARHLHRQWPRPRLWGVLRPQFELLRRSRLARPQARGHRRRHVHPSPFRPCRLEHLLGRQPVGADLPQCALSVRARPNSKAGRTCGSHEEHGLHDVRHLADSIDPIVKAGLADLIDTDHRISTELFVEPSHGHTPGHVHLCIESNGERGVITGDLMHHPIQCALPGRPARFRHGYGAGRRPGWASSTNTRIRACW